MRFFMNALSISSFFFVSMRMAMRECGFAYPIPRKVPFLSCSSTSEPGMNFFGEAASSLENTHKCPARSLDVLLSTAICIFLYPPEQDIIIDYGRISKAFQGRGVLLHGRAVAFPSFMVKNLI